MGRVLLSRKNGLTGATTKIYSFLTLFGRTIFVRVTQVSKYSLTLRSFQKKYKL